MTSALMAVTRRNAVASVLWLVGAFVAMAVLFIGMDAGLLGVIQVLVYAGAIMMLFLFVIMLLRLSPSGLARMDRPSATLLGLGAAGGVVALLCVTAFTSTAWTRDGTSEALAKHAAGNDAMGRVAGIADSLFSKHIVPFEMTSVLLLAAIVGAVALTKRKV